MFKKSVFLLILVFIFFAARSQTKKTDSLKRNIIAAIKPQLKIKAIFALCDEWQSLPADSTLFYLHQAERLSQKINSPALAKDQLRFYTACYYMKTGKT